MYRDIAILQEAGTEPPYTVMRRHLSRFEAPAVSDEGVVRVNDRSDGATFYDVDVEEEREELQNSNEERVARALLVHSRG